MRIYFRYLFMRVLAPFAITLLACTMIWVMVDLYGNLDDFLSHKINVGKVLYFYALQFPSLLVQVLPAAILFSTLWTLLSMNRRSEIVALQAGGMAPTKLFAPFVLFALIWVVVLAVDLNWPAPLAQVTRARLIEQVKGRSAQRNVFTNLPFVDTVNHRVWMFHSLDLNQNSAREVELHLRDPQGHDTISYFAQSAKWNGEFWQLTGVHEFIGSSGSTQVEKIYEQVDLPDVTTPPNQLALTVSQPEELTVAQLSEYIRTSTTTQLNLAKYRTEWWYRWLHPLSLLVLLLYALLQVGGTHRRSMVTGVVTAIAVLFLYILTMNIFMAAGRYNRLSPFLAAIATQLIFGGVAIHLLAVHNGWWMQLWELWKKWQADRAAK